MLAAVGEFLTDKSYAVKVSPHGEFLVVRLSFPCRSALLRKCLVVEGEGEDNVTANLACVEFAVEAS